MRDIGHLTTTEAADALKHASIAILPIGAIEQHGPHLELRTDTAIATKMAALLADGLAERAVLCPAVQYGLSDHHMSFAGTITLRPNTLRAVILDIAESLKQHGISKIAIVNGHGGNIDAIRLAAREALRDHDIRIAHLMWAQLAGPEISAFAADAPLHNHACQVETSIALHLEPELVRRDQLNKAHVIREPDPLIDPPKGLIDMAIRFEELTTDGALGDPRLANADTGTLFVEAAMNRAVRFCRDFAEGRWDR